MSRGERRPLGGAVAAAMAAVLLFAMAACQTGDGKHPAARGVLRVLAGSELADLRPILEQAERDTGVRVRMDHRRDRPPAQDLLHGPGPHRRLVGMALGLLRPAGHQ
jgi:Ca-activated chloride channel family protein